MVDTATRTTSNPITIPRYGVNVMFTMYRFVSCRQMRPLRGSLALTYKVAVRVPSSDAHSSQPRQQFLSAGSQSLRESEGRDVTRRPAAIGISLYPRGRSKCVQSPNGQWLDNGNIYDGLRSLSATSDQGAVILRGSRAHISTQSASRSSPCSR